MLLQRRRAKENLTDYARFIDIPGVPLPDIDPLDDDNWTEDEHGRLGLEVDQVVDSEFLVVETELSQHHELILDTCQDLVENNLRYYVDDDGDCWEHTQDTPDHYGYHICRRVMLMFPPGSAKSTYASVVFPTWQMGNNPGQEIILTGYGDVICKRHGKRARQICAGHSYNAVFGFNVDPTTRAADNWETANKSSYKSAGILSGITGFRCDGLIWDDITKGRKEADSVTIREDTWNAYIDDARSRKKPKAWEVGIGTRWHEDETMGRILPEGYAGESGYMQCRDGNVWYVLCVPAECESETDPIGREIGEMLWPEWFTEDFWADKRVNPRSWASLYQQRPALEEGLYFKREWDRRWNQLPDNLNRYISFDPAVSEEEDADDTCIEVWGVDENAKVYLVDEWYSHCTMDVWIPQLITLGAIHQPLEIIGEAGVIRRAAEPYIAREMRETGHFFLFEWVTRSADKSAMARSYQAMMSAGNIYFPATSVGDDTVDELMRFPASKTDHRVDAGANFFLRLEAIWEAAPPTKKKQEPGILEHGFKVKQVMPPRHSKKRSRWSK
jgi:predicted phage terminase large subunit-like protein